MYMQSIANLEHNIILRIISLILFTLRYGGCRLFQIKCVYYYKWDYDNSWLDVQFARSSNRNLVYYTPITIAC